MTKLLIFLKRYSKSILVFILVSTMLFFIFSQFVIQYKINSFIGVDIDEIKEVKILQKDISVITDENKYLIKEFNIKNEDEIKSFINSLNEIRLRRDFQNELLNKLGQWVRYPETNSSISYEIHINTLNKAIEIELTSGNTYIALNIKKLKEHIEEKQYYFKIKDGFDERFLKRFLSNFN